MSRERAKELLKHYFSKASQGTKISGDCFIEIEQIVDDIIDIATEETIDKIRAMIQLGELKQEVDNR